MLSAAMVVQDRNEIESDTRLPSNAKTPDIDGIELKEAFNHVDDFAPKVRKPYTITKQRERWTEEEHKKFLEALKLYGRAWRKIEEHVGSKTAVQIRSHAQKFFSKVVRECNNGEANCSVKPIEIPPPRPKRKPMHPYPRKLSSQIRTGISISEQPNGALSSSEQDNQSPSSVLSTVGSDSSCNEQKHEILSEKMSLVQEDPNGSTRISLKLFGKTFSICSGVSVSTIEVHNPRPVKARLSCENMCKDEQKEGSSSGSNSDGEEKRVVKSKGAFSSYKLNKKNYGNCRKGFVPYKRCVMEKNSTVVQPVDVLEA